MIAAQSLVDRWFRKADRGPFSRAVARTEESLWDGRTDRQSERSALRRAANAIRLGRGHALTNPAPIIRIVKDALAQKRPGRRS